MCVCMCATYNGVRETYDDGGAMSATNTTPWKKAILSQHYMCHTGLSNVPIGRGIENLDCPQIFLFS